MNEFIVWDEDSRKFIDESYPFYINSNGILCIKLNNGQMILANSMKYFRPIGKTDIVGNKIYADSSIVELVDSGSRGIFFFDEKYLKFKFAFNGDIITSLGIESFEKTAQFKIIGTLQENQELLGVNK